VLLNKTLCVELSGGNYLVWFSFCGESLGVVGLVVARRWMMWVLQTSASF
jgi:hypothetical protein